MKFLFFIFIISLIGISLVQAVGFSPSSLIYELEQNQEECKMITITSDSETISVSDKWAESKDVEWKTSLFETGASVHGIFINYDDELSIDEREVEVCLSGQNIGEYHGVMMLSPEIEGSSIVQMGVWLKVTIIEPIVEETTTTTNNGGGGGSSGGGNIAEGSVIPKNTEEVFEETEELIEETNEIEDETQAGITGAVIGGARKTKIIGITFAIIIIAGLIIHNRDLVKDQFRRFK